MNEKYLSELKEMENRLYEIINLCGENVLESKLSDAWSNLYDYLREHDVINVSVF